MIQLLDEKGLSFWPEELVASITPAYPNRLRVVCSDGTVGYMPLPVPAGPWIAQGDSWVQPALPPEYRPEPHWGLLRTPDGLLWDGLELCLTPIQEATQDLVQAGDHLWIHPRRLRRLENDGSKLVLQMDVGSRLTLKPKWKTAFLKTLGIPSLPPPSSLPFLQDYPFELARAPAAQLRENFSTPADLIANQIWQQADYHQRGIDHHYGSSPRGFWYNPLEATVQRLGGISDHQAELIYYRLLARMVDEEQLFGYRELGFEDPGFAAREIGAKHPGILLVIEKTDLGETGIAAARHFGLSWHITGGISRILTAEFCAYALQQAHTGPIRALIFGDYDPGGRVNGRAIVAHLARFGTHCPAGPEYLIEAAAFTEEELELFSHPLSQDDERVENWLQETGGIHGQPRGIHADWLQPPDRLIPLIESRLLIQKP